MPETKKAAAFGEILWDILPGKKCLGGAPFNCGAHLNRLGFKTTMLSALGDDQLGQEALSLVNNENVSSRFINMLSGVPTGFTNVVLNNGKPSYEFNSPCAWDYIAFNSSMEKTFLATHWDVFCFGTLAQRSVVSRKTLFTLLEKINADIKFFDINLRKEFYTDSVIEQTLKYTDILKMNDEEFPVVSKILGITGNMAAAAEYIIKKYGLKGIIITAGKSGTTAFFNNQEYRISPENVPVIDTVGAGDSFSAAFLASYINGHSVTDALSAGSALADFVVSHSGALPEYDSKIREKLAAFISPGIQR
ncbi:MAG: carbohydrate kinase [Treponema sp.]|nr:carbohydrate kinase [Treponema sp.]